MAEFNKAKQMSCLSSSTIPPSGGLLTPRCFWIRNGPAKRHGVRPNQIYGGKTQVLDNIASLFGRGVRGSGEEEREAAKLSAKIGQLTVERDFLGRRPGRRARRIEERWSNGKAKDLSVRRQGTRLNRARSGVPKPGPAADDLAVMRRIDELHRERPFDGARRMRFELTKEGRGVNRKRVRRLMRVRRIEALVPRPGTSKAAPGHKIYPCLPRGLAITPNHVGASDITYIPMAHGYLVASIDWAELTRGSAGRSPVEWSAEGSRAVLAWRLSNTIDSGFCVDAREEALARQAEDSQHGSGRAVHQRRVHRQA
jgi:HTH-like domain